MNEPPRNPFDTPPPRVPDHELFRPIGRGAFGEVWLARNLMGTWRAIKVVRRSDFQTERPLQREFNGICKFEPVSRTHEGLVDILQLGANDTEGYFYYVMELADDANAELFLPLPDPAAPVPDAKAPTTVADEAPARGRPRPQQAPPAEPPPDLPEPKTPAGPAAGEGPRAPATPQTPSSILHPPSSLPDATGIRHPQSYLPKTLHTELRRRGRLPFAECLRIALSLADALRHLHSRGLIHRDIKPANIIFVNGIPKLADIGLVADAGGSNTFVGTEGYVPPEGPGSPQADLYSLGKLLYEISTGLDRLRFPEPNTDLATAPDRDDWLEFNAIVLRACESDPARRYPSAEALHQDLVLLQGGKSIRRLRSAERWLKTAKRAALMAVPALLLLAGGYLWQQNQARRFNALAQSEKAARTRAEEEKAKANDLLDRVELQRVSFLLDQQKMPEAFAHLAQVLRRNPSNCVASAMALNHLVLGGFPQYSSKILHVTGRILTASFSPDGRFVATLSDDRVKVEKPLENTKVQVWDTETGAAVGPALAHTLPDNPVGFCVSFSSDGRRLVTIPSARIARVWQCADGAPVSPPLRHEHAVVGAVFTADGSSVATLAEDHMLRVWDVESGKELRPPAQLKGWAVALSPDQRKVIECPSENCVQISSATNGQALKAPICHAGPIYCATFSPDGLSFMTGSYDKTARIWDASSGMPVVEPFHHEDAVLAVAFTADGRRVVTASRDHTARVWDAESGQQLGPVLRHENEVWSASFSADGRWLMTASGDRLRSAVEIRRWALPTGNPQVLDLQFGRHVNYVAFSPDSQRVATASEDNTAQIWETQTGLPTIPLLRHEGPVYCAAFSPNGRRLVTGSRDQTARLWDTDTGQAVGQPLRHTNTVCEVAWSPDGRWFATSWCQNGPVWLWEAATGEAASNFPPRADCVWPLAFCSDNHRIVAVSQQGTSARVWDVLTGRPAGPSLENSQKVSAVAIASDGSRAATGSRDGSVRVWEVESGRPVTPAMRHGAAIRSVAFDSSGKWLVTSSDDKTVHVWNARTGDPIGPTITPPRAAAATFSPDGRSVMTSDFQVEARLWDARTGQAISPPMDDFIVGEGRFSPDRRWIVTPSMTGAHLWPVVTAPARSPEWLPDLLEAIGGMVVTEHGGYSPAPTNAWGAVAQRLSNLSAQDDISICGKWLVADRWTRTLNPWSSVTMPEYGNVLLRQAESGYSSEGMNGTGAFNAAWRCLNLLSKAADCAPTNGIVYAHLARATLALKTSDSNSVARAEFWSRRALRFAPESEEVKRIRSEILEKLSHFD